MYSLADINELTTLHNRGKETEPGVIWLYEEPILLEERYKKPYYKGILEIHNNLERIETNWWTPNPSREIIILLIQSLRESMDLFNA